MSSDPGRAAHRPRYEVRVEGQLARLWSDWFDGLDVTNEGRQSVLIGELADEAALHGVLAKIRDLGLQLISVQRLDGDDRDEEGGQP